MKNLRNYKDYMDCHTADEALQSKTMDRIRESAFKAHKEKTQRRPIRTVRVCIVAAVCIALTITAYALANMEWSPAETADTGAGWEMTPISTDDYNSYLEKNDIISEQMFYLAESVYPGEVESLALDEEMAEIITLFLENKVFTADGMAFDLLVQTSEGFVADDRGFDLFDEKGTSIGRIDYKYIGSGKPFDIAIFSKEDVSKWYEFPETYEEAVKFLGYEFRLPTVYIEDDGAFGFKNDINPNRRAVYISGHGMYMFVEINGLGTAFDGEEWFVPESIIEETEFNGTIVYKISNDDLNRYTWSTDNLTYMFFQFKNRSSSWSDEQCEEIIRSMI
ncbi:MAG: hypothetical protein FWG70_08050 [Oscillospiraceae bacterium]|nr:hypothetical protein [Oscillospiraceae bacterium]